MGTGIRTLTETGPIGLNLDTTMWSGSTDAVVGRSRLGSITTVPRYFGGPSATGVIVAGSQCEMVAVAPGLVRSSTRAGPSRHPNRIWKTSRAEVRQPGGRRTMRQHSIRALMVEEEEWWS